MASIDRVTVQPDNSSCFGSRMGRRLRADLPYVKIGASAAHLQENGLLINE
jgi:hypothetical protein